jgi:hypothetical protein
VTGPLRGPLTRLLVPKRSRRFRYSWLALVCLVLVIAVFRHAQLPTTPTTPSGLELELPGTADGALAVLRAFDDAGALVRARVAIDWDFLVILGYSIGLAAFLEGLAAKNHKDTDALIGYAAWGALFAGLFDVFENIAMLRLLAQYPDEGRTFALTALAGTLASLIKWTLLSAVLGYSTWEIAKTAGRGFPAPEPARSSDVPSRGGGRGEVAQPVATMSEGISEFVPLEAFAQATPRKSEAM